MRSANDLVFFEENVNDVADRAQRQYNLIIFGLEESDQNLIRGRY